MSIFRAKGSMVNPWGWHLCTETCSGIERRLHDLYRITTFVGGRSECNNVRGISNMKSLNSTNSIKIPNTKFHENSSRLIGCDGRERVDMTWHDRACGYCWLSDRPNSGLRLKLIFLTSRRRIKSHLPFAGIIRRLPYSTGFQDKG